MVHFFEHGDTGTVSSEPHGCPRALCCQLLRMCCALTKEDQVKPGNFLSLGTATPTQEEGNPKYYNSALGFGTQVPNIYAPVLERGPARGGQQQLSLGKAWCTRVLESG